MKAYDNSNTIHVPIAKKLRTYNIIPHEWRNIYKNGGKPVSEKEKGVLWTLIRLSNYYQTYQLKIDYAFLIKQTGFYCSQPQMRRYLKSLQETNILNFAIQNGESSYKKILIIKIDANQLKAYLPCTLDEQICKANLQGHYIDKNRIKNKEKIKNKKDEVPTITGLFNEPVIVDKSPYPLKPQMSDIIVLPQIIRSIDTGKEQESYFNQNRQLITPPAKLKKYITKKQKNLGVFQPRVETLLNNLPPGGHMTKIGKKTKNGEQLEFLTECRATMDLWEKVSKDFKNYYGETLYKAWFNDIQVDINSSQKAVIVKVKSPFFKNYIETNYLHNLSNFMAYHDCNNKIKIEVKE